MRPDLPESIRIERVVPVARRLEPMLAVPLVEALLAGGLSIIEVTVEAESGIEALAALAGAPVVTGAGTVTSVELAEAAVEAGARFLVSPHLDRELLDWASRHGVPFLPGGLTPTEVWNGWSAGAAAVKLFPAMTAGPDHIRRLLGPYPDLMVVPTGGVDASNASGFLEAGAVAVGVGSWLTGSRDWALVAERAAQLREVV